MEEIRKFMKNTTDSGYSLTTCCKIYIQKLLIFLFSKKDNEV